MSALPADRAFAVLIRALRPIAEPFEVVASQSRDWASATFEGARHRLALRLEGADAHARAHRLADTLPEIDIPLAGGFVADIVVAVRIEDAMPVLGIEALTIAEAAPVPLAEVSGGGRRCG